MVINFFPADITWEMLLNFICFSIWWMVWIEVSGRLFLAFVIGHLSLYKMLHCVWVLRKHPRFFTFMFWYRGGLHRQFYAFPSARKYLNSFQGFVLFCFFLVLEVKKVCIERSLFLKIGARLIINVRSVHLNGKNGEQMSHFQLVVQQA